MDREVGVFLASVLARIHSDPAEMLSPKIRVVLRQSCVIGSTEGTSGPVGWWRVVSASESPLEGPEAMRWQRDNATRQLRPFPYATSQGAGAQLCA